MAKFEERQMTTDDTFKKSKVPGLGPASQNLLRSRPRTGFAGPASKAFAALGVLIDGPVVLVGQFLLIGQDGFHDWLTGSGIKDHLAGVVLNAVSAKVTQLQLPLDDPAGQFADLGYLLPGTGLGSMAQLAGLFFMLKLSDCKMKRFLQKCGTAEDQIAAVLDQLHSVCDGAVVVSEPMTTMEEGEGEEVEEVEPVEPVEPVHPVPLCPSVSADSLLILPPD